MLFCALWLACSACSQSVPDRPVENIFPTASTVRLFVNTDYAKDGTAIYSKPGGLLLNAAQRAEFESALRAHTISPDETFAACFIPHHFFRYFDANGKMIGEIEVCFCCAGVEASGASNIELSDTEDLRADYTKLETLVRSLGEPTDVQCDGEG